MHSACSRTNSPGLKQEWSAVIRVGYRGEPDFCSCLLTSFGNSGVARLVWFLTVRELFPEFECCGVVWGDTQRTIQGMLSVGKTRLPRQRGGKGDPCLHIARRGLNSSPKVLFGGLEPALLRVQVGKLIMSESKVGIDVDGLFEGSSLSLHVLKVVQNCCQPVQQSGVVR